MLNNLLDLVKQHAGDAIINNTDIPNERNDEAVNFASNSIFEGLQKAIAGGQGGGVESLIGLFKGGGQAHQNPITQNIQSNVVQGLMSQFGLGESKAGGIASMLIPIVMNQLVHKTNDPNDNSFDLQDIFNKVSGGKTGGLDIGGLLNQFTGGGEKQQGSGGLLDSIKGLFGK